MAGNDDGVILLDLDAGRCCGRAEEGRRVPAQLRGRPPPHLLPEQDGGELHFLPSFSKTLHDALF